MTKRVIERGQRTDRRHVLNNVRLPAPRSFQSAAARLLGLETGRERRLSRLHPCGDGPRSIMETLKGAPRPGAARFQQRRAPYWLRDRWRR
jgi:hypothetical protein